MTAAKSFRLYFPKTAAALAALFLVTACGSGLKRESTSAEGRYQYAQALEKEERYEEALLEYQEVKNKHPYSRFAVMAELAVADLHYKRESFIEAQGAYEVFKSLHPQHAQTDHVTFRLGMTFFNQLPSSIDRDLSLASRAILHFDEVMRKYPNSDFAKEAAEKRTEAKRMLAQKEFYIADFYFMKEKYGSALGRYERALKTYTGLGFDERALYGAAASSYRSGAMEKAQRYSEQLLGRFPDSDYARLIKEERKKYVQ